MAKVQLQHAYYVGDFLSSYQFGATRGDNVVTVSLRAYVIAVSCRAFGAFIASATKNIRESTVDTQVR